MPTVIYRFGDFELEPSIFELRRRSRPVKLQRIPMELLIFLIEKEGQIASRQEIVDRLWGRDVFVDTEAGINTAIRKIRQALREDSENPRFLQTVTGKGYRFIGAVRETSELGLLANGRHGNGAEGVNPVIDQAGVFADPKAVPMLSNLQPVEVVPKARSKGLWFRVTLGLTLVAIAAALAFVWQRMSAVPTATHFVQLTHDGRPKGLSGTDGTRLYFMYGSAGGIDIGVIPVSGGEMTTLPHYRNRFIAVDVSRDGSQLLSIGGTDPFQGGPLWVLPLPDGPPRRVGDLLAQDAHWSPDGKKIAYCLRSDIYVADADGRGSRKIATVPLQYVGSPVWSPDGGVIRVAGFNPPVPPGWIWEVNADGSNLHPVLSAWAGTWTSSGKYFLYPSEGELWALPRRRPWFALSNTPIQVTSSPISLKDVIPAPDGKRLYLMTETKHGELQRLDKASGHWLPFLDGISAEFVDFSKDGQWVAYVTYPEGKLWRSRTDGSDRLQLSDLPAYHYLPRWSPDGKTIIFCVVDSTPIKAYTVSAEGGVPIPLAEDDAESQADPTWSPDGSKILLSKEYGNPHPGLRLYDWATHRVEKIAGSDGLFSARWDPSGHKIVAMTSDGRTLKLFDVDRQTWSVVMHDAVGGWPAFSHDGQWIYLLGENGGVLRVRVKDQKVETVSEAKDFMFTGRFLKDLMLTPDDEPVLLRDAGSQDIYSLDWKEP